MTSACVVTYNSAKDVCGVLNCLVQTSATVFVVDNGSTDDTATLVKTGYPGVRLIEAGGNLGFGSANNVVIPHLKSRYHLIVNPDVTFAPDLLSRMAQYMDEHPEVAILTPRVYFENGEEQFIPKRRPSLHFMVAGALEKYGRPFTSWRKKYTGQDLDLTKPFEETFATGCFMFIRTEVFKKIGGFDERFFMYMEDADLTLRALKYGKALYHPDFTVVHSWKRESMHSRDHLEMHLFSMKAFMKKWGWRL